ncbi:MAG: type IV toxin-antitoxin system AbiEi family antitoxin, partial [Xanthomonadales bacterium]|nr:type IV toxin-antitoxin system AbiEi family antitoxin [Xanthomonadales bacterium]
MVYKYVNLFTVSVQKRSKLNRLEQALPEGLLVDASWLERRGYYRSQRSQYVSAGWLAQPVRGVFCRPRGVVSWEQVVISLQTLLEFPVSVGGRSALELQGYAHYLSQSQKNIHLYCDKKLPAWVFKLDIEQAFISHNRLRYLPQTEIPPQALFLDDHISTTEALGGALGISRWGQWKWPLVMSTPERAFLELLDELPQKETFHMADVIMEGLVNLSPRRMQPLLETCTSVKVKRLFFFFAERHKHRWLTHINQEKIDLG